MRARAAGARPRRARRRAARAPARLPPLLTSPRAPARARAGKAGPLAWGGGLICISLAAFFEYEEYKYKPAGTTWTIGEAVLVWVMLAGLSALVVSHFALGSKRHLHASVDEPGDDEGGRSLLQ